MKLCLRKYLSNRGLFHRLSCIVVCRPRLHVCSSVKNTQTLLLCNKVTRVMRVEARRLFHRM